MVQKQECVPFCLQNSCIQASTIVKLGAHKRTYIQRKGRRVVYVPQPCPAQLSCREGPCAVTQEVFAPFAELNPVVFGMVFLVPAAEPGCKSWLPQSYGHQLLPSTHPASESKSAKAVNRQTFIEQLCLTFQCRWAPVLLSCTQVWTLCCCCCKHGTTLATRQPCSTQLAYSTDRSCHLAYLESAGGKGASRVSGTVGAAGTGVWIGSLLRLPRGFSHPSGTASERLLLVRMSAMTYSEFHMVPDAS